MRPQRRGVHRGLWLPLGPIRLGRMLFAFDGLERGMAVAPFALALLDIMIGGACDAAEIVEHIVV